MAIKQYLKRLGSALTNSNPVLSAGVAYNIGKVFGWDVNDINNYDNKIVYAVTNLLVRKLIEVPVIVNKVKNQKDLTSYKSQIKSGIKSAEYLNVYRIKALEELENHPLKDLLDAPNLYQTGRELKESFWFNYVLTGDAFLLAEIPGDESRRKGQPIGLHVLPSNKMSVSYNKKDMTDPIINYVFKPGDGTEIIIPKEQVMHLKKWNPKWDINGSQLAGYSPQNAAAKTISKNEANQVAQGVNFENNGTAYIISGDPQKGILAPEQMDKLKEHLTQQLKGYRNQGNKVYTNGKLEVNKIGDSLAEMQLIAAERSDWKDIASIWGVSDILLNSDSAATESNVKIQTKNLVTNVIVPELQKFDEKLKQFTDKWYNDTKIVANHDITSFSELAPDLAIIKTMVTGAWWFTGDEIRQLFNFDVTGLPEMNKFYLPSGLVPIEDAGLNATNPNEIDNANKSYDDYR